MIPFDTFTLAAVAAELRQTAQGASVQKIRQPSPHDVTLSLYGRAGPQQLLICADPQSFRLHLTQVRRENPTTPPGFCQVCRRYLEGARLEEIALPRFDRVLRLIFRAHDGEAVTLIAELMGRNANLVLVGGTGRVRGLLRPPPPDSPRPLRVGEPYADPPGYNDKPDPLLMEAGELRARFEADAAGDPKSWLTTFSGIGPFAAGEVLARAGTAGSVPEALAALMAAVREAAFQPHTIADAEGSTTGVWAFEPLTVPPGRRFARESVSVALDTFYSTRRERDREETERTQLARMLARETAFREREIAAAQRALAEAGRAEDYERSANLLLAHLPHIGRGAASVTLPDLYASGEAQKTIPLNPKRSPHENAESYFERARRARDAARHAADRLEYLREELATLAALQANLERAESSDGYPAVRNALRELVGERRAGASDTGKRPAKERPFGGHRIRTVTVEGYELLVGETAEANDYLTTRVAAPADLWLHVRAGTGAHGVLRTRGREKPPEPVVRRAAEIVAARSGSAVKHARLVAVTVVEKRYVRKPRGAKPGLVTYTGGRTLDVTPGL